MKEADTITSLLSDNWISANTGGVTPIIDTIINRNNIDVRQGDFILTYNTGAAPIVRAGSHGISRTWTISIDIRTLLKTRFDLYINEVTRILFSKYYAPGSGYCLLYLVRDQDLSDRSRGMNRRVIDVALTMDNQVI
jgi:hypothetical protein